MSTLTFHRGDCIAGAYADQVGTRHSCIAHGCNDIGAWGAGFTAALDAVDPAVGRNFRSDGAWPLGTVLFDDLVAPTWTRPVLVANLVTQRGVRSVEAPVPFRYHALSVALRGLYDALTAGNDYWEVHMPRIGCGLAGAVWEQVEPFVRGELVDLGISVHVYDL